MAELIKRMLALPVRMAILVLVAFTTVLTGCSFDEGDDLDQYMRDATKDVKPRVQPLPEVQPYMALQYNSDGMLVDPFRARKATNRSSVLQPNLNRPKEPMEAYPLESLKYVGSLSRNKLTYALLKTPDETIQQVKLGNYVGQNFGKVIQIKDSEVLLAEIVQDDLTGEWIERTSSLLLQEE